MKRLLYVDCCIRGQTSRTRRLAEAFLDALPQGWAVEPLELAAEGLQYFSGPFFQQRQDLLAAGNRTHPRFRYAWQFAQADAIVLAAPLWDLCFPAQLKLYLENIYITGIVTRYDEAGCPVGLCRAQKLYYVSTSGGPYDPRFSYQYLRALCVECFGIPETELLMAENLDVDDCDPEAILRDAMSRYGLTPQP